MTFYVCTGTGGFGSRYTVAIVDNRAILVKLEFRINNNLDKLGGESTEGCQSLVVQTGCECISVTIFTGVDLSLPISLALFESCRQVTGNVMNTTTTGVVLQPCR